MADIIFKALADPTRRLILDEFSERNKQTLYELCARLAMKHKITMSRQAITKHVNFLEEAGLIQSKKSGKYRVLTYNSMPIIKITKKGIKGGEKK